MNRITGVALSLVAIFSLFFFSHATTSSASLTPASPMPVIAPGSPVNTSLAGPPRQTSDIAPSALEQIAALEVDKESRTPAQQKIDSQLLYATRIWRGESIASYVQTLTLDIGADDAGSLTVDITAAIDDELLQRLADMGVEVSNVFPQYHSLRTKTSLDQLEKIAGFPQVRFIQPKQEATSTTERIAYTLKTMSAGEKLPCNKTIYTSTHLRVPSVANPFAHCGRVTPG